MGSFYIESCFDSRDESELNMDKMSEWNKNYFNRQGTSKSNNLANESLNQGNN